MKKLVVGSRKEEASRNILKELGDRAEVMVCNSSILELDELGDVEDRLVIVASPHSSSAGVLSLSVHSPGNFGPAKYGGEPRQLSVAPALYLGESLRKFREVADREGLPHDVTLEVTHHGPTHRLPVVFVELGSDKRGWRNQEGARAAAEVIEHLLGLEPEGEALIGIGGPHYAPSFTRWTLEGRNFGHICPKYAVKHLDEELMHQMVERTWPGPSGIVLEWKGIPGSHRERVVELAEGTGLPIEKVR